MDLAPFNRGHQSRRCAGGMHMVSTIRPGESEPHRVLAEHSRVETVSLSSPKARRQRDLTLTATVYSLI
jgi:hypothetical protein